MSFPFADRARLTALALTVLALAGALLVWRGARRAPHTAATQSPAAGRPSCAYASASECGHERDRDCCESLPVEGGTFKRSFGGDGCQNADSPATISAFRLDTYQVTVGRFRAFVASGHGTRATPPPPNAGRHPAIPSSGWKPSWNDSLAATRGDLERELGSCGKPTWSSTPRDDENLPINCVTWYEAFAFCAWDGGRLPTEAEWNYAAAGGAEQRVYPWSSPPTSNLVTHEHAVYAEAWVKHVGSHPAGNGRWGHADLAGNVWDWTLDTATDPSKLIPNVDANFCSTAGYPLPCIDCAQLGESTRRIVRGGGFGIPAPALRTALRRASDPSARFHVFGLRCARDLDGDSVIAEGPSAPPLATTSVSTAADVGDYPPGPYGIGRGEVLANWQLRGFIAPERDLSRTVSLRLSDLRRGRPSPRRDAAPATAPRAILVLVYSIDIAPSTEALAAVAKHYAALRGKGVEFLTVLVNACTNTDSSACRDLLRQGREPAGADGYAVESWVRERGVTYPTMIDEEIMVSRSVDALPDYLVVDPASMRVVARETGTKTVPESIWQAVTALLAPAP